MPSDFVKKNKKKLAKTCLVKTDVSGLSWETKIEKEKPDYFIICKGNWPRFVLYHKLEIGDVLLFLLIDKSMFHVMPYSKKRSINLHGGQFFQELSSRNSVEEAKMEPLELSDSKEEIVDPSGGSKDGGNSCYSHLVDPNNKHPYFSNLLGEGFADKIQMPAAFVKEHKKMLAKTALLKTDEGLSWEAKIVREVSDYFICQGEWPLFVAYNKLELRDMLIFNLVDKTTFHVLLYSTKPCTNIRHCEELSSSDEEEAEKEEVVENVEVKEDEEEIIEASRRSKKVKTEAKESSSAHGTRSTESGMVEHSIGNLVHSSLAQSSKRKRLEAEDDVSVDMHIKIMEVEKSQQVVASPSFTREDQLTSGSEDCKMHTQQSSMFYLVRRTVMDKQKSIAYQSAKANFKSKNPFFISFMHPSYISILGNLCIKLTFARKYIPENCSNIVLRVAGRGSWPVIYYLGPAQARISTGWRDFVVDNQLKLGDVCVFEVITGTQVFMDVTIFRAAGSMPMPEIVGPDHN